MNTDVNTIDHFRRAFILIPGDPEMQVGDQPGFCTLPVISQKTWVFKIDIPAKGVGPLGIVHLNIIYGFIDQYFIIFYFTITGFTVVLKLSIRIISKTSESRVSFSI